MATYSSAASGNWTSTATWTPNTGYPVAGDTVTIAAHTVTVDAPSACLNLTTSSPSAILNTGTVSVSGNFTPTQTLSGTATIELLGGSTWAATSGQIGVNIVFNGDCRVAAGGHSMKGGTITYTSGVINCANAELYAYGNFTINTGAGVNWYGFRYWGTYTVTLSSDMYVYGFLATQGTDILNGYKLYLSGYTTAGSTGTVNGTTEIVVNGTMAWGMTIPIGNKVTIDCGTSTMTVGSVMIYGITGAANTLTYTSGTVSGRISFPVSVTCDLEGMTTGTLAVSANVTITNLSSFDVGTLSNSSATTITFAGAYGYNIGTLTMTTVSGTIKFVAGQTVNVNTSILLIGSATTTPTITSTSAGTDALINWSGKDNNCQIFKATLTDLDASSGKPIYAWKSTLSGTANILEPAYDDKQYNQLCQSLTF